MDLWSDRRAGEEAMSRKEAGGNDAQRGVCDDAGKSRSDCGKHKLHITAALAKLVSR